MGGDGNYTIGPGFWGFVAFFVMAIALWLLVRNMSGRLRRMAYQERQRDGAVSDREAPEAGVADERWAPTAAPDVSPPGGATGSPKDARPHGPRDDEEPGQPDDNPNGEPT